MTTLMKMYFATLVICLVSVQSVSAQQKGPCTDTDVPAETEGTEEDSDDNEEEEADVQRDDNGNYWWNDNGEIKRVWPRDDPNAPWNQASKSTASMEGADNAVAQRDDDGYSTAEKPSKFTWSMGDFDQANPNDSPGPDGGEKEFADDLQSDGCSEIEGTYQMLLEMGLTEDEAMSLLFGGETTEDEEPRPTKITKPLFGPLITTF